MKLIELTQGQSAMVDDEDFDRVNQFKWYAYKGKYTYYGQRTIGSTKQGNKRTIHIHRFVLNTNYQIDHIDGNGLNNQKYNLRICTTLQNNYNTRPKSTATSQYKGVYFDKRDGIFIAQIKMNYKSSNIGRSKNEILCAKYYDAVARFHFGEFAFCNFEEVFIKPMCREDAKLQMKELREKK